MPAIFIGTILLMLPDAGKLLIIDAPDDARHRIPEPLPVPS